MLAAFLSTILFSISAVTAHRTSKLVGGIEANFWRLLCATALLAIYAHSLGAGLSGTALGIFLVSGGIGFGIGDFALFQALPKLGSRLTILLVQCLAAPIAALIEWLWLGTTLNGAQLVCGAAILTGVALALSPSEHLQLTRKQLVAGVLFGSIAAVGQAGGAVLSRVANAQLHTAGQEIDGITAAYQRILGGIVVTAMVFWIARHRKKIFASGTLSSSSPPPAGSKHVIWPWIFVNALAGPTLGVSCYQWALKTTPTGIVLPIVAITPLVIIPFARVVEGERPTHRSLVGGMIAVVGVVALTLVSRR
ncbi:MAG: EamA family transporter [Verrucomicrobia bacterium]|nr:EamA family transporter [Verrucomicrobiota bacterium]